MIQKYFRKIEKVNLQIHLVLFWVKRDVIIVGRK